MILDLINRHANVALLGAAVTIAAAQVLAQRYLDRRRRHQQGA